MGDGAISGDGFGGGECNDSDSTGFDSTPDFSSHDKEDFEEALGTCDGFDPSLSDLDAAEVASSPFDPASHYNATDSMETNAVATGNVEAEDFEPVPESQYSEEKTGFHEYTTGPNMVCPKELECTEEEMVDQLSRYAFPGQDPSVPVENLDINTVSDPRPGLLSRFAPGGDVRTYVSEDGLTVVNQTMPGHIFHDGIIERELTQVNGDWFVTTRGVGNNTNEIYDDINEWQGQKLFDHVDEQMRINIEAHH